MGGDRECGETETPAGDSAGTYYLSIEEFESRLPRTNPPERRPEAGPGKHAPAEPRAEEEA